MQHCTEQSELEYLHGAIARVHISHALISTVHRCYFIPATFVHALQQSSTWNSLIS